MDSDYNIKSYNSEWDDYKRSITVLTQPWGAPAAKAMFDFEWQRLSSSSGTRKYTILEPLHRRMCRIRRSVNVLRLWNGKAGRPSYRIKVNIDSWQYKYCIWNLMACEQQLNKSVTLEPSRDISRTSGFPWTPLRVTRKTHHPGQPCGR